LSVYGEKAREHGVDKFLWCAARDETKFHENKVFRGGGREKPQMSWPAKAVHPGGALRTLKEKRRRQLDGPQSRAMTVGRDGAG
jgi:hypothetical protein